MKRTSQLQRALLLSASAMAMMLGGCDDETTAPGNPGQPSVRVLGTTPCGKVFLPTVQPDELRDEDFRAMAVTVNGRDPSNGSGLIDPNTEVILEQEPQGGTGSIAFLSSFSAAREAGLNRIEALQQAGSSFEREFLSGVASDQVICVTEGAVRIRARIADYNGTGEVIAADQQTFAVTCLSPADYDDVCGTPVDADMAGMDMGVGDGGMVDAEVDAGVDGDQGVEIAPALWSVNYIPNENLSDLVIGIRNSGLGRRDNVALSFGVTELGVPLSNIPVKFVLSSITQPAVTISTGAGIFEEEGTSIALTGPSGVAEVRVIAGDTPGLAVVRAVGLRLPTNRAERAQLFEDAECVDDGREGYECMFDAYCPRTVGERDGAAREELCEVDRSSQVVIIGGIPSGRGMQLDCARPVIPAFTYREDDLWLTSNEPGTDCTVQLGDRVNGRISAGTQVLFLTEAGTFDEVMPTDEFGRALAQLRVGDPPPVDVEPDDYELDAGYLPNGYNPRDGLVRLVAVTRGEEDFVDTNGDKIYTPGQDLIEPGQDLPEPYIDSNDNGRWDPDEEFRDANDDGVWTDANGTWDANTEIWTSTTVLWTGELYNCRLPGLLHEDCGCAPIGGRPVPDDCRENVGGPMRNESIYVGECLNNGCTPDPVGPACSGAAFELAVGGAIAIKANYLDINGNCLSGIDGVYSAAGRGVEVTSNAAGTLRRNCFSAHERPLGLPVVSTVARIDGGGGAPAPGEEVEPAEPEGEAGAVDLSLTYPTVDGINVNRVAQVPLCLP